MKLAPNAYKFLWEYSSTTLIRSNYSSFSHLINYLPSLSPSSSQLISQQIVAPAQEEVNDGEGYLPL